MSENISISAEDRTMTKTAQEWIDMADRCEELALNLEYETTERSALKRSFDEIADRCETQAGKLRRADAANCHMMELQSALRADLKRAVDALVGHGLPQVDYRDTEQCELAAELRERWFAEEEGNG